MKKNGTKKGFTLVELLVVISIIGILTTLLMVNFVGTREKANDSKKVQDLNSVKNALRMYYNDNQTYPDGTDCTTCLNTAVGSSYLPNISSIGYTYSQLNSGDGFILTVPLEGGSNNSNESQINCNLTPTPGVYAVCTN